MSKVFNIEDYKHITDLSSKEYRELSEEEKEALYNEDLKHIFESFQWENHFREREKNLSFDFMTGDEGLLLEEVNEKTGAKVGRIFEASRANRMLYKLKNLLSEIASVLYRYQSLQFSNNRKAYNSTTHYKRVIKQVLDEFSDVKCFGLSFNEYNSEYGLKAVKVLEKLNDFTYKIEGVLEEIDKEEDKEKLLKLISDFRRLTGILISNFKECNFYFLYRDEYGELFDVPGFDFEVENLVFTDGLAPDLAGIEENEVLYIAIPKEE